MLPAAEKHVFLSVSSGTEWDHLRMARWWSKPGSSFGRPIPFPINAKYGSQAKPTKPPRIYGGIRKQTITTVLSQILPTAAGGFDVGGWWNVVYMRLNLAESRKTRRRTIEKQSYFSSSIGERSGVRLSSSVTWLEMAEEKRSAILSTGCVCFSKRISTRLGDAGIDGWNEKDAADACQKSAMST